MAGEKIAEAYVLLGADLNPLLDALKRTEDLTRETFNTASRHGVDFGNVMNSVSRVVGGLGASLGEAGTSVGPLALGLGTVGRLIGPIAGSAAVLAGAAATAAIQFGNTERNLLTSAMLLSGYHMTLGQVLDLSERMAVATNRSRDEIIAMLPPILQAGMGAQDLAEFFQLAHAAAFNTGKTIDEVAPKLARLLSPVLPSGAPAEFGLPTIPAIGGPMMDAQVQEAVKNALRTLVPVAQQFDRETTQGAARGLMSGLKDLGSAAGELASEIGLEKGLRGGAIQLRLVAQFFRHIFGGEEKKMDDILQKALEARAAARGTTVDALLELGPRDPMMLEKTHEQTRVIEQFKRRTQTEKDQRALPGMFDFWPETFTAPSDDVLGGTRTGLRQHFGDVYGQYINPQSPTQSQVPAMIDPQQIQELIQAIQLMGPPAPESRAVPKELYEGLVY